MNDEGHEEKTPFHVHMVFSMVLSILAGGHFLVSPAQEHTHGEDGLISANQQAFPPVENLNHLLRQLVFYQIS
jgi:hypothetical protein